MIFKSLKKQTVSTPSGEVEVRKGELVQFTLDPGDGWEEVTDGGDSGTTGGTVGRKRSGIVDDDGGV